MALASLSEAPEPRPEPKTGSPLAKLILVTLEDSGMTGGLEDTAEQRAWLAEYVEAPEPMVVGALTHLCVLGLLEYPVPLDTAQGRPQMGWGVPGRWDDYLRYRPTPLTELERKRRQFEGSAIRRKIRDEIARGLHRCPCGSAENLHVDHVVALARGGTNDRGNLQVLCGTCNCRKGARV